MEQQKKHLIEIVEKTTELENILLGRYYECGSPTIFQKHLDKIEKELNFKIHFSKGLFEETELKSFKFRNFIVQKGPYDTRPLYIERDGEYIPIGGKIGCERLYVVEEYFDYKIIKSAFVEVADKIIEDENWLSDFENERIKKESDEKQEQVKKMKEALKEFQDLS